MGPTIEERCAALVAELGLAAPDAIVAVRPLTGGVASDIAMVDLGTRRICVKFALPKLKVAADWRAPLHRNAAEYAWLKVAADVCPDSAVALLGRSADAHGFAMAYLEGPDVYLWKSHLLEEQPDQGEAARVGALLGRIHAASTAPDFDTAPFGNRDDFRALRIEPYLTHTRAAYPDLSTRLTALEERLYTAQDVLVHGDASPKNILFRDGAPILLDAECATMGDASFDPAFCLNHLILKAVHLPGSRARLLDAVGTFWSAYSAEVSWEDVARLEARVCQLLPALMLARVDGKSPVEYLDEAQRKTVRRVSIPWVLSPATSLQAFVENLAETLREGTT